jgi:hypothetical protein
MNALNSPVGTLPPKRRIVTEEVFPQKSIARGSREDISAACSTGVQMRRIHTEKSEHTPRGFRLSRFFHRDSSGSSASVRRIKSHFPTAVALESDSCADHNVSQVN